MSFGAKQLPEPPEKPRPGDCCGNGCNPCVLDVYEKLLQQWKEECGQSEEGNVKSVAIGNCGAVLSMTRYMPFQLVSVNKLTSDTNVYRFQTVIVSGDTEDKALIKADSAEIQIQKGSMPCSPGQHLFLRGRTENDADGPLNSTSSDKYVTRAYTPITDAADHANGMFDVIVKIYIEGEMSAFIDRLEVGNVTFWRGPYGSFQYSRNSYKYTLMLCAGTGIAPMYSIAKQIVNDDRDDTRVRMIFVCKSVEDILLRNELHTLRSFWNFSVDVFVTRDYSGLSRYGETIRQGRLGREQVKGEVEKLGCNNCLVLICGPPSFNEAMTESVRECSVPKEHVYVF